LTVSRGEIWYADLDPTQGSEQSGVRPVLVVQNDAVNRYTSTILSVPLTTNLSRASLPTCIWIPAGDGGLASDSVALCHQTRALDVRRLTERLGSLSPEVMRSVTAVLAFSFGIRASEESGD
jgi:mRNA interferase MazF